MATLEMRAWERIGEKFMLDVAKVRWVVCEKERPMVYGEQGVLRRIGRRSMMAVDVYCERRDCGSDSSYRTALAEFDKRPLQNWDE